MTEPSWITKELFEDSLRNFYKTKSVDIKGYCSEAAVPVGDSYTSYLYRVTVSFTIDDDCNGQDKIKTISTLVKSQPTEEGAMKALSIEMSLFPIEIKMFGDTLRKLHKILGEDGILSSKCLLIIHDPPLLVLEDLSPLGYKMMPRQYGLDLNHCTMVIQKLAKMHAASLVLISKEPETKDFFKDGMYFESEMVRAWMRNGLESVVEVAQQWPGCEKYAKKLKALGEKAIDRGIKACERNLEEFNVLNHGDCWSNNILFSYYPNGVLKDARFVDFQLVTYKSPAVDLHYFIATSTSSEVRIKHLDTLLNTYHSTLTIELGKLKYNLENIPTRSELQKIFEDKAFIGMVSAITVLPIVRASSRPDASFNNLMKESTEGSFRQHCYTNDRYRAMLEYQLKYYDDLGIFD